MELELGTQIISVPTQAEGDTEHPDSQAGFVTSVKGDVAYCRYWGKYSWYSPGELRTKSGSERTPIDMLIIQDTVPKKWVDAAIDGLELP